ncbi:hypothetical protein ACFQV2_26420 [Actinokineospora soli]|uniref:Uncharacterized protein n=1 Tax=Actinokineospora soli TaxID=1048753 RepID=A0ABW2TRN4_9PSEU
MSRCTGTIAQGGRMLLPPKVTLACEIRSACPARVRCRCAASSGVSQRYALTCQCWSGAWTVRARV